MPRRALILGWVLFVSVLRAEIVHSHDEWLASWVQQQIPKNVRHAHDCNARFKCFMPQYVPSRQNAHHEQLIPRIIWQAWPSKAVSPEQHRLMSQIIALNPEYEYIFLTRSDWRKMICDLGSMGLHLSAATLGSPLLRARLGGLLALQLFGGILIDTDVSGIRPFDELIAPNASMSIAIESEPGLRHYFMASTPHHPIVTETIDILIQSLHSELHSQHSLTPTSFVFHHFKLAVNAILIRHGCTASPVDSPEYSLVTSVIGCPILTNSESTGYLQILIDNTENWNMTTIIAGFRSTAIRTKAFCRKQHNKILQSNFPRMPDSSIGAVAYLLPDYVRRDYSPRGTRICGFNMSMNYLVQNWRPFNAYPVILMGEAPWSQREMDSIRRTWPSLEILFTCVAKQFQLFSANDRFEDFKKPLASLGYKRMCAFWFSGFLEVPLLQKYRYIFRLDDDSCIRSKLNFDVFRYLEANEFQYAFRDMGQDPDNVVHGLSDFVIEYVTQRGINATHPTLLSIITEIGPDQIFPTFDTNIEIIDTHRFREADIADFAAYISSTNMIFHRRWGDAPLRLMEALLFLKENQLMRVCDFAYQHSSWPLSRRCRRHYKSKKVLSTIFNLQGARRFR